MNGVKTTHIILARWCGKQFSQLYLCVSLMYQDWSVQENEYHINRLCSNVQISSNADHSFDVAFGLIQIAKLDR